MPMTRDVVPRIRPAIPKWLRRLESPIALKRMASRFGTKSTVKVRWLRTPKIKPATDHPFVRRTEDCSEGDGGYASERREGDSCFPETGP